MNAFDEMEWEGFSEYKRPEIEERRKRRRRRRGGDSGSVFSDPLTAVLLHFDSTNGFANFLDSGAKGHNFFPQNGAALTTSRFKFGGSSAYITSSQATAAGGIICDGSAGLALGAGNFVVDLWYNTSQYIGAGANSPIIDWGHDTTNNTGGIWIDSLGQTFWINKDNVGAANRTGQTIAAPLNTWVHLAVVRSGGTTSFFVNGVLSGTPMVDPVTYATIANAPGIGVTPALGFSGGFQFIDEVRVSIGTDRGWSAGFTPPVAPYSTDASTQLLLHFEGANGQTTYVDDSGHSHTLSNSAGANMAVVDTSQFKFGTSSLHISGSGTSFMANSDGSSDMALGAGDFVVDFWFRAPSYNDGFPLLLDFGFVENATCPYMTVVGGTVVWIATDPTAAITASAPIPINTWTHIALVRKAGTTRLFLNGVQTGADFADAKNYPIAASGPAIGGFLTHIHAQEGWYDEFRISKGTDRGWFGGFTPPTLPYAN